MAGSNGPSRAETAQILTQVGGLLGDAQSQIALTIHQMEQRLAHLQHVRNTLVHQGQNIAHQPIHDSRGSSIPSQPPPLNYTHSMTAGSSFHPPPSNTPSSTRTYLDSSQGFSVSSGPPSESQSRFPVPVASSSVNAAALEFPLTDAPPRDLIPRPPPMSPCSPVGPPQNRTVQTQRPPASASATPSTANFTGGTSGTGNFSAPSAPSSPDIPPFQSDNSGYQIVRCPECNARVGIYFEIHHLDHQ